MCLFPAFGAHQLAKSVHQPVADSFGGFRGYIPKGNSRAPRGHYQVRDFALPAQCVFDLRLIVWYHQVADDLKPGSTQQIGDHRTGDINPLPPEAGVAYGNDSSAHQTIVRGLCERPISGSFQTMRE